MKLSRREFITSLEAVAARIYEDLEAKQVRDFRRGFEIARIALERRVGTA
jgi:hypothetical protein